MNPTHPAEEPAVEPATEPAESVFTVVRGQPTAEELAALTAVVLSLRGAEPAAPEKSSARHWVRRQQLQLAPRPGPGSWKRSRG